VWHSNTVAQSGSRLFLPSKYIIGDVTSMYREGEGGVCNGLEAACVAAWDSWTAALPPASCVERTHSTQPAGGRTASHWLTLISNTIMWKRSAGPTALSDVSLTVASSSHQLLHGPLWSLNASGSINGTSSSSSKLSREDTWREMRQCPEEHAHAFTTTFADTCGFCPPRYSYYSRWTWTSAWWRTAATKWGPRFSCGRSVLWAACQRYRGQVSAARETRGSGWLRLN